MRQKHRRVHVPSGSEVTPLDVRVILDRAAAAMTRKPLFNDPGWEHRVVDACVDALNGKRDALVNCLAEVGMNTETHIEFETPSGAVYLVSERGKEVEGLETWPGGRQRIA